MRLVVRHSRWLITVFVVGASAFVLMASSAAARSVCGQEPAVGVVYRVAAVHLNVQITGHFQDAAGDYQDATFSMNGVSHPRFDYQNFGDFGGCPGDPPSCFPGAAICKGVWWSMVTPTMTTVVTESGFDSGVEDANPPSSSSCQGSYVTTPSILSAWRFPHYFGSTPRTPKLSVGGYVGQSRFGTCVVQDVEVVSDVRRYVLGQAHYAPTTLPVKLLWHARRHFTLPVSVSYSGPIPVTGDQYYQDPGASTTVSVHWQGSISFVRAYTCTPNGCMPPQRLPPASDSLRH